MSEHVRINLLKNDGVRSYAGAEEDGEGMALKI